MQNYYNQVSEQKRIAFIDNLTDAQAKVLSTKYPFAICFANNVDENHLPVIWYNERRYGFTCVKTDTISIGDANIGLQVSSNGELSLNLNEVVDEIRLTKIYTGSNVVIYDIDNNDISQPYTLETLNNDIFLQFKFFKAGNEINANYTVNFDDILNNYSTPSKTSNTNEYKFNILSSSNNSIFIKPYINVNSSKKSCSFTSILKYVPNNCAWYNGETNISELNIYRTQNTPSIKVKLDGNLNVANYQAKIRKRYYPGNGTALYNEEIDTITNSNNFQTINLNEHFLDNLKDGNLNYTRGEILLEIVETQPNKSKLLSQKLTINIKSDTNQLIWIGTPNPTINNLITTGTGIVDIPSSTITNYNNIDGWYLFDEYDFNTKDQHTSINSNTIIILPTNYGLALPIYDENSNAIQDPMWIEDNNTITINDKEYSIYRYNNEQNDLSSPKLLSIIKLKNNIVE